MQETLDLKFDLDRLLEEVVKVHSIEAAKDVLYRTTEPTGILLKAVGFCIACHEGQFRKSGDPYAIHPILVCAFVAHFGGDEAMLLAALLHDVVEDTACDEDELKFEFGNEVALLVNGLTKITAERAKELAPASSNEKLAASAMSFRNIILKSVEDVRVLVIKLCDRLHNLLTLGALRPDKQRRIAEETLLVYVPIAHMLGISQIKKQLEDISFPYVLPQEYRKIDEFIQQNESALSQKLANFSTEVAEQLALYGFEKGVDGVEIHGRIKHRYSIYLKMQRKGIGLDEVLDLLAVRILVNTQQECYAVLGILHTSFKPLISRFKDYIALRKQNGYQTIHTTLFYEGSIVEAQIRTHDMHKTAEYGIAAHWKYKHANLIEPNLKWLDEIKKKDDVGATIEDVAQLAQDSLYTEDIIVQSPKGAHFTLPRGSTALDYAYQVHSQIGLYAKEAVVNDKKVPLLTELKNGDRVSIITGSEERVRTSWLSSVKTAKAKSVIREVSRTKVKELNLAIAYKLLAGIFGASEARVREWVEAENLTKKIAQIATNSVFLVEVVATLKKHARSLFSSFTINKQKFDNIVVYSNHKINAVEFDYCCSSKRGDDILGFRRGRQVVVHNKLCDRAAQLMQEGGGKGGKGEEMIFVKWTRVAPLRYRLIVSIENRRGSLAELLTFIAKLGVDVVKIKLGDDEVSSMADFFEMVIEIGETLDAGEIRRKIESRFNVAEFKSAADAYA